MDPSLLVVCGVDENSWFIVSSAQMEVKKSHVLGVSMAIGTVRLRATGKLTVSLLIKVLTVSHFWVVKYGFLCRAGGIEWKII